MRRRPTIDERTGTTIEQRRAIRKKQKKRKAEVARGIHSGAVSDAYRDGYDAVFRKPADDLVKSFDDDTDCDGLDECFWCEDDDDDYCSECYASCCCGCPVRDE
jgi:hypothetical protein